MKTFFHRNLAGNVGRELTFKSPGRTPKPAITDPQITKAATISLPRARSELSEDSIIVMM